MSLAFDESGRPFIILREQGKKKRTKGLEAHKVSSRPSLTSSTDQHSRRQNCSQSPQDLSRPQGNGQDARFARW